MINDRLAVDTIAHRCAARIAIVEDNKELAYLLKQFLVLKGIHVSFVAYDGDDAIKKYIICSPKPDILITDYRLPTKNGIETMKEILLMDHGAKIIFLTADSDIENDSLQAGARLFLKKPASMKELYHAIYTVTGDVHALN
jgi:DNA-binding response OmpR family regulator